MPPSCCLLKSTLYEFIRVLASMSQGVEPSTFILTKISLIKKFFTLSREVNIFNATGKRIKASL